MTDLVALTREWAVRQLLYSETIPFGGKYPRTQADEALIHSTIAQGLAAALPYRDAKTLLEHVLQRVLAAQVLWNDDERLGWRSVEESLENLASAYARLGIYDAALKTVQYKQDVTQRALAIADVAVTAFKAGDLKDATELSTAARIAAGQIENQYIRAEAYAQLLPYLVQLGDFAGAIEVVLLVTSQGTIERNRLHHLIYHLCENELFDEAEQVARHSHHPVDKGMALCDIAAALAISDHSRSQALTAEVEEIVSVKTAIDDQIRLYSALIVAYFHLHDQIRFERYLSMASELLKGFEPRGVPTPQSDYIIALAKVGRVMQAQEAALSIVTDLPGRKFIRPSVMEHHLAQHLIRARQYENVRDTARLLAATGEPDGQDLYHAIRILLRLALQLTDDEQFDEARTLIDEIVTIIPNSDVVNLQIFFHYAVTRLLARYQRFEAMFTFLDRVGIDSFVCAIALASEHFEAVEKGISVRMLREIITAGMQKHPDYAELLPWVEVSS